MSTVINFSKSDFPTLGFQEFPGKYCPVAFEELGSNEQEFMSVFLTYACPDGEPDLTDILLVKAADGGILKDIYGPSLFQDDEGNLVLKVGSNVFPVTHKGGLELRVGGFEGQLSFESKPITAKQKDTKGEEYEVELYPAKLELLPDDGSEWQFNCQCSWDASTDPTPAKVKQTLKRGESIAKFFRTVPKPGEGGGDTFKLQDLGEGEFSVESVRVVETKSYGDRYVLKLTDGREAWTRGNVETVLKDADCRNSIEKALSKGEPVTLAISSITQRGDRTYVDCALRLRAARKPGEEPKAKTMQQQRAAAKNTAPSGATTKVATATVDADIPF